MFSSSVIPAPSSTIVVRRGKAVARAFAAVVVHRDGAAETAGVPVVTEIAHGFDLAQLGLGTTAGETLAWTSATLLGLPATCFTLITVVTL